VFFAERWREDFKRNGLVVGESTNILKPDLFFFFFKGAPSLSTMKGSLDASLARTMGLSGMLTRVQSSSECWNTMPEFCS